MKTHILLFFLAICVYGQSQTEVIYTLQNDDLIGWDGAQIPIGLNNKTQHFQLSTNSGNELIVFSTDNTNKVQWAKKLPIKTEKPIMTSDGVDFIYIASRSNDINLVKMTTTGKVVWSKKVNWPRTDVMKSFEFHNGRLVMGGITNSLGNFSDNPFALTLDTSGQVIWSTTLDRSSGDVNGNVTVYKNEYYFSGNTTTNSFGKDDIFMAKLGTNGGLVWYKHFGTSMGEGLHSICELDGNIYAGGVSTLANGNKRTVILKVDTSGSLLNSYTYDDANGQENVNSIAAFNGRLLVNGRTGPNKDLLLTMVLDKNLNLLKSASLPGKYVPNHSSFDQSNGMYQLVSNTTHHSPKAATYLLRLDTQKLSCNESKIVLKREQFPSKDVSESVSTISTKPTLTNTNISTTDVKILKKDICIPTGSNRPIDDGVELSVYPNPANQVVNIQAGNTIRQITLVGINGKAVYRAEPEENQHKIDVIGLPSGIYLADIRTSSGHEVRKVLVQH